MYSTGYRSFPIIVLLGLTGNPKLIIQSVYTYTGNVLANMYYSLQYLFYILTHVRDKAELDPNRSSPTACTTITSSTPAFTTSLILSDKDPLVRQQNWQAHTAAVQQAVLGQTISKRERQRKVPRGQADARD